MHKHFGILILLLVAAFVTSCTSPQKEAQPDAAEPPAVAKKPAARLVIRVAADGTPISVEMVQSSGLSRLDQHTADWIKKNWRWPASGRVRTCVVPVYYKTR